MDLIGDGNKDLQTESPAPSQGPGNLAVLVVGTAIYFVGNQHRSAIFQPPDRTGVG